VLWKKTFFKTRSNHKREYLLHEVLTEVTEGGINGG
jgi:hypothetical protein